MKRRKFMQKKPAAEEMPLQITSMADIMVILLVFLLKSFSSGISVITPSAALTLPEVALAADQAAELLKMEISKDAILIDDKPVTKLNGFAFEKNDVESDGTPRSLNIALIRERERHIQESKAKAAAAGTPVPETEDLDHPKLMIMADQKVPYKVLQRVLASAGSTGFADFKLAVVEDK
jgi:biopolymer transport protein ExbD